MHYKTKYLIFSTALVICLFHLGAANSETTISKSVVDTPQGTTIKKTVTETTPDSKSVHSTTTTEKLGLVQKETRWKMTENGRNEINVVDFDVNGDGMQSRHEIGETLFKLYDTDGNSMIDNNEYKRRAVVTIIPMQTNTVISYDHNGDGKIDETQYTYDSFSQSTMLTRYDKNFDGLSAREFTGLEFMAADINDDKLVDLKEWQGVYMTSVDKANKQKAHINK